jgi:hypothetical protein
LSFDRSCDRCGKETPGRQSDPPARGKGAAKPPGRLAEQAFELARGRCHVHEPGRVLREAPAPWRGEPLADFRCAGFATNEIARLEELRLGRTGKARELLEEALRTMKAKGDVVALRRLEEALREPAP